MTHEKNEPTEKHAKHKQIKKDIDEWFKFFRGNIKRYKKSMRFAYKETVTPQDRDALDTIQKSDIEINYIQAYLSRLLGEFAKQSPDVIVTGNGSGEDRNVLTVEAVEGHMKSILDDFHKQSHSNQLFKEQCGGGFSVMKVKSDYKNNKTFEPKIVLEKSKDPVMCFFDPMAKLPSKSDGKYCGELIPMLNEDFKKKYPKHADKADDMHFSKKNADGDAPFSWSYVNSTASIVIVADCFCVEYKQYNLLRLANNEVMKESDYNKMVKDWDSFEPKPEVVKRRTIKEKTIKRYVIFGEDVVHEEATSLTGLPYIFVDGDSAFVYKDQDGSEVEQVTRSYIHNAMDAQRFLNVLCQTIADYTEGLMKQPYILEQKTLVGEEAWTNPQRAAILLWNGTDESGNPLPPPTPARQPELPAAVMQAFSNMQAMMQNTLGTYDAMLGINQGDLSGIAIQEGATQNNAVAMPFITSYLDALTAALQLILEMIPKHYVTPMTIPYMDDEGKRQFVKINQQMDDGSPDQESISFDYDKDDLDVNVTAGASFAIQKDKALKMLEGLAKAFPGLAKAINEEGLDIIAANLDMHDSDKLKQMLIERKKKAESQPEQPDPAQQQLMLKQQEMQMKQQQAQVDTQLKREELEVQKEKIKADVQIALLRHHQQGQKDAVQAGKIGAEIQTHNADNEVKLETHLLRKADQHHNHTLDIHKHNHTVRTSQHKAQE